MLELNLGPSEDPSILPILIIAQIQLKISLNSRRNPHDGKLAKLVPKTDLVVVQHQMTCNVFWQQIIANLIKLIFLIVVLNQPN